MEIHTIHQVTAVARYDVARYDVVRYDAARYDVAW